MREDDGRPREFFGMWLDISDRKQMEQNLLHASKLEAVGRLTGGIAHDFNNMLSVVIGNLDLLQSAIDGNEKASRRARLAMEGAQRCADLTNRLLSFSRRQPLQTSVINLRDLVPGMLELLQRTLGERIEVHLDAGDDLWPVDVDPTQFEAALVNLAVNARDAMPHGGAIVIAAREQEVAAGTVDKLAAGRYVCLSVTDNGDGMDEETLARATEPFFTTKGVGKGTGLGLSMVYGFIRQSNGHIAIDSEVGRGTTFRLYLPRGAGEKEEGTVCQQAPIPGGRERILVVEDDPQVRASVVRQLQRLGYTVSQAPDGAVGVAAFEAATQPYDLLLTDVIMPGPLNGKALADEVARRWPKTRVLFMSGYSEDVITHHGRLDAGVRLLSKPFRMTDLATTIREVFDEQGGAGKASRAAQRAA
jgi:nitrogen-specific signal transduction histidine kinase/ActR/RegA family two-component response regulator